MVKSGDKSKERKKVEVRFETKEVEKKFNDLKFSNIYLYRQIGKAIETLRWSPKRGKFIPINKYYKIEKYKRFWKYKDTGLYKYPLGKKEAYRLLYTIEEDKVSITDIITEWGPHDLYKDLLIFTPTFYYVKAKIPVDKV